MQDLKLYIVSRLDRVGFDEIESATVIAKNREEAKYLFYEQCKDYKGEYYTHLDDLDTLEIKFLEPTVVLRNTKDG